MLMEVDKNTLNTQCTQQNNWWHASKHRHHIHGPMLLSLTNVMCVLTKSGHITHADTTPLSHRHTGRIKRRCARFICRSKAGVWLHQCIIAWCFWGTLILTRQALSNLRPQVYPSLLSFKDGKNKSSDSFVVHLVRGLWAGPLTCQLCSHTCLMFADMSVCSMQMTGDQSRHTEVFWGSCHVCLCDQHSNGQQPVATNCHLLWAGGCHGVADLSLGLCEWSLTILAFLKWNCMWKCRCLTCIKRSLPCLFPSIKFMQCLVAPM